MKTALFSSIILASAFTVSFANAMNAKVIGRGESAQLGYSSELACKHAINSAKLSAIDTCREIGGTPHDRLENLNMPTVSIQKLPVKGTSLCTAEIETICDLPSDN